jgi:hypothetical protein
MTDRSDDDRSEDAARVEKCRAFHQAMMDRAVEAMRSGASEEEFFGTVVEPQTYRRVMAPDLREIGDFTLEAPSLPRAMRRHWVYVNERTGETYAIGWRGRLTLQQLGYAEFPAIVADLDGEN